MRYLALLCLVALAACGTGTIEGSVPAPSELTVTQLGSGLHVTWKDNSTDEDEFAIERKAGGSFGVIGSVTFDTVAFHDEPLNAGTVYTYRVRATRGATASAYRPAAARYCFFVRQISTKASRSPLLVGL